MKYVYLEEDLFGKLSSEQKEKLDTDSRAYDSLFEDKDKLIAAEAL